MFLHLTNFLTNLLTVNSVFSLKVEEFHLNLNPYAYLLYGMFEYFL